MDESLLDTDILSEILKQRNSIVTTRASEYLQLHGRFTLSIFTRFEIQRGYKAKQAQRLLSRFDVFCQHCTVLPLTDRIFDRAAELWAIAKRNGHPHGDADLLIGATALESGLTLATGNTSHFSWMPGLKVIDWRTS